MIRSGRFFILTMTSFFLSAFCLSPKVPAQSTVNQIKPILNEERLAPAVALFQIKQYLIRNTPAPPTVSSPDQWRTESSRLRRHLLENVVYHGWPQSWIDSPLLVEDRGIIETGQGYRIRKLRYEIGPGFYSAALVYEPEIISGKVPAIVNVNGHVGAPGKTVEYKQKRCIHFARQGIIALNLEWFCYGELDSSENRHAFGAQLDLVGSHHLGLFYQLIKKGVDYLWQRTDVDHERIGMTGLSGGGWQTIVVSALEERISVAVPVAGFASTRSRVEARERGDLGDLEQSATNLLEKIDYPHLVAMRAPRPTLLIYNAEDDCCFRGPIARPYVFDAIQPLYRLMGHPDAFQWHENREPGTHNYQRDNRLAAYRFFAHHFRLKPVESESPVDTEVRGYNELTVGLPSDNMTILGLAKKLANEIVRTPIPPDGPSRSSWRVAQQKNLINILRYQPTDIERSWLVANSKNREMETLSYLFEMHNGLSIDAVLLKPIHLPDTAPVTVLLHDEGIGGTASAAVERLNRGEQVLSANLMFFGDAWKQQSPSSYAQIIHGQGQRTLGLQAAQLLAITRWILKNTGNSRVRIEAEGMRTQAIALAAAAIQPELFAKKEIRQGLTSWQYLLEKPVPFAEAPELFCLDLYKEFDIDRLSLLSALAPE